MSVRMSVTIKEEPPGDSISLPARACFLITYFLDSTMSCLSVSQSVHPLVQGNFRMTKNVISCVPMTTKFDMDQDKVVDNSKMKSKCKKKLAPKNDVNSIINKDPYCRPTYKRKKKNKEPKFIMLDELQQQQQQKQQQRSRIIWTPAVLVYVIFDYVLLSTVPCATYVLQRPET